MTHGAAGVYLAGGNEAGVYGERRLPRLPLPRSRLPSGRNLGLVAPRRRSARRPPGSSARRNLHSKDHDPTEGSAVYLHAVAARGAHANRRSDASASAYLAFPRNRVPGLDAQLADGWELVSIEPKRLRPIQPSAANQYPPTVTPLDVPEDFPSSPGTAVMGVGCRIEDPCRSAEAGVDGSAPDSGAAKDLGAPPSHAAIDRAHRARGSRGESGHV